MLSRKSAKLLISVLLMGAVSTGCKPEIVDKAQPEPEPSPSPSASPQPDPVDRGVWDARTSFPGSGYFAGISDLPATGGVCSASQVFGVVGTAVCQSASGFNSVSSTEILSGLEAWDDTGTLLSGTLPNRGAFNAQAAFPGPGYYNGTVLNAPIASQIVAGNTVLGVAGSYTGNYKGIMASNAFRDPGVQTDAAIAGQTTSSQISLQAETVTYTGANLPSTGGFIYRDVPDARKDDEGYQGTSCKLATRPTQDCGLTQSTVAERIADCAMRNPTSSTWDGATKCNRGQGAWSLVYRDTGEVWLDRRTGLLWSSRIGNSNWCWASGSTSAATLWFVSAYRNAVGTAMTGNGTISSISGGSSAVSETITVTMTSATAFTVTGTGGASGCQGGAITSGGLTTTAGSTVTWSKANVCSFTLTQGAVNFVSTDKFNLKSMAAASSCSPGIGLQPSTPFSICAEGMGLVPAASEDWNSGSYVDAKGKMGRNSAPAVYWRLPTLRDYQQANLDGLRMVMPDAGAASANRATPDGSSGGVQEWTATVASGDIEYPWVFHTVNGLIYSVTGPVVRSDIRGVRCVGRFAE